jgi:hypothetical protein
MNIEFENKLTNFLNEFLTLKTVVTETYYLDSFKSLLKDINGELISVFQDEVFLENDIKLNTLLNTLNRESWRVLTVNITNVNVNQIKFKELFKSIYNIRVDYKIDYNNLIEIDYVELKKILETNIVAFTNISFEIIPLNSNLSGILNRRDIRYVLTNSLNLLKPVTSSFHLSTLLYSYLKFNNCINNEIKENILLKLKKINNKNKILNSLYSRYIELKIKESYLNVIVNELNISNHDILAFLNTVFLQFNKKIKEDTYIRTMLFIPNDIYLNLDLNYLYILNNKNILIFFLLTKPNLYSLIPNELLLLLDNRDWDKLLSKNPMYAKRLLEVKRTDKSIKTFLTKFPDISIHLIQ